MKKTSVPRAMKIQLARLFGEGSRIAKADVRSDAEWRRDLKLVLVEVYRYLEENIETDIIHSLMMDGAFAAANLGLESEEFWPSYAEAITRIALCLMGDYPDHHKRKAGSKKADHYKLNLNRSSLFIQSTDQKLHTLFWPAPSKLQLSRHPSEALHQFRNEVGFNVPIKEFLVWYKQNFPDDYGKVF